MHLQKEWGQASAFQNFACTSIFSKTWPLVAHPSLKEPLWGAVTHQGAWEQGEGIGTATAIQLPWVNLTLKRAREDSRGDRAWQYDLIRSLKKDVILWLIKLKSYMSKTWVLGLEGFTLKINKLQYTKVKISFCVFATVFCCLVFGFVFWGREGGTGGYFISSRLWMSCDGHSYYFRETWVRWAETWDNSRLNKVAVANPCRRG